MRGLVKALVAVICGLAGLGAVLVVGLVTFGLYVHHARSPRFAKASNWSAPVTGPVEVVHSGVTAAAREDQRTFVGDLAALEAAGEFGELGAMAMNLGATLDPQSRAAGMRWFEERVTWGRVPSLFVLSRLYAAAGEMDHAAECYMAGSLSYRIDAECVVDPTARQAAAILESELKEVRASLRENPDEVVRCIGWALEFEEAHKDREPAYWIAAHGIGTFKAGGEKPSDEALFVSPEQREQARARMRHAFEKMRDEAGVPARGEAPAAGSGRTPS